MHGKHTDGQYVDDTFINHVTAAIEKARDCLPLANNQNFNTFFYHQSVAFEESCI